MKLAIIGLTLCLVAGSASAHEEFMLPGLAPQPDWLPGLTGRLLDRMVPGAFPLPTINRGADGCSILFTGDRQVMYRGTEDRPDRMREITPGSMGPDVTVYAWKAVQRQFETPCDGVQKILFPRD